MGKWYRICMNWAYKKRQVIEKIVLLCEIDFALHFTPGQGNLVQGWGYSRLPNAEAYDLTAVSGFAIMEKTNMGEIDINNYYRE